MPTASDITSAVVTPQDIRMFLIDRNAGDNYLLNAPEFENDQVASALRLSVDKYNSTTPIIGQQYDATNFPHRYALIIGAASILLKMMAINLTRNRLNYQTEDGTAVDDKARGEIYLKMAQDLSQEFDSVVKGIKVSQNISNGFGSVGSPFARWQYN